MAALLSIAMNGDFIAKLKKSCFWADILPFRQKEKSFSVCEGTAAQEVTFQSCLLSFSSSFPKSSSVIFVLSCSQLKVTRCLQIRLCSFNRTRWPKLLRSQGAENWLVLHEVCVSVWLLAAHLLVWKCSSYDPRSKLRVTVMCECAEILLWE